MPRQDKRIKIDAPLDDIVEMVRGAMERPADVETEPQTVQTLPMENPQSDLDFRPGMEGRDWRHLPESNPPTTLDRIKEAFANAPKREDYQPSKLRRFAGAVTGGLVGAAHGPEAGYSTAQTIVNRPFDTAYQDFAQRAGLLEKQAALEAGERKLGQTDFSSMIQLQRLLNQSDPALQGQIAGAQEGARESAREPGRVARDTTRRDINAATITGRATEGAANRQNAAEIAEANRKNAANIAAENRRNAEAMNRARIVSAEEIARMRNDLQRAMQETRNQRVPPNQQFLAEAMAENKLAMTLTDEDEFEALFTSTTDSNGRVIYQLKPEAEVESDYRQAYRDRKAQINAILGQVLGKGFNPAAPLEEDQDDEDRFTYEEQ